jgi:hypothetical protein
MPCALIWSTNRTNCWTKAGGMTDRQYRPILAGLMDSARRRLFRERLRRQAWLLDRCGDSDEREVALAVAASMDRERSFSANPFLRGMLDFSIEGVVEILGE